MNKIKCIFYASPYDFPNGNVEDYIDIGEEVSRVGLEDFINLKENVWIRTEGNYLYYSKRLIYPPTIGSQVSINGCTFTLNNVDYCIDTEDFIYYDIKFAY